MVPTQCRSCVIPLLILLVLSIISFLEVFDPALCCRFFREVFIFFIIPSPIPIHNVFDAAKLGIAMGDGIRNHPKTIVISWYANFSMLLLLFYNFYPFICMWFMSNIVLQPQSAKLKILYGRYMRADPSHC